MLKSCLVLAIALSGCSTAKICRNLPASGLKPISFRTVSDGAVFGPVMSFSDAAVSAWNGHADENCGLPNATIDDSVLSLHFDGTIYLEGTGDWSNGLTGYESPVFVEGGEGPTKTTAIFAGGQ